MATTAEHWCLHPKLKGVARPAGMDFKDHNQQGLIHDAEWKKACAAIYGAAFVVPTDNRWDGSHILQMTDADTKLIFPNKWGPSAWLSHSEYLEGRRRNVSYPMYTKHGGSSVLMLFTDLETIVQTGCIKRVENDKVKKVRCAETGQHEYPWAINLTQLVRAAKHNPTLPIYQFCDLPSGRP